MMMIDVIPQEFFDGVPVPPAVTLDGELLGALDDAPAGAWLAQMIEGVDVTSLTTFELATYLRQCARAQAWLASVGLAAFGNRYPHMLSGGQRKRVGLAQVLIRDPKILLMDEPFGPLDAQTRQIMGNLLLQLWTADRKAVLFVTHDLEEAIALADRVVIMSAGPHARIIGDWRVPLSRPRDISEVRMEEDFHALHREIWSVLKDEVMKGYAQSSQAPVEAA